MPEVLNIRIYCIISYVLRHHATVSMFVLFFFQLPIYGIL